MDEVEKDYLMVLQSDLDQDQRDALKRLVEKARLGAAVEAMPYNSALRHLPMNDSSAELTFPVGAFPWVLERVGDGETQAADPLTALTWHNVPVGGPLPPDETKL